MLFFQIIKASLQWMGLLAILLISLSVMVCTQKAIKLGAAFNLTCEYQTNPLGIDVQQPRLSWAINDDSRGAVQSAYQILVASSEKMIRDDKGDIWDSGEIQSDASAFVPYAGPALASGKRYFWKVRIWNRQGEAMPFSNSAWWEMGLLHASDWQAKWIGKAIEIVEQPKAPWPWGYWIWHPTQIGIDRLVFFRADFQLAKKKVKQALIRATADNYFTVFLNGKEIGSGSRWTEVYEFKIDELLQTGKNQIAVQAANNLGEVCGLIFSLKIDFDDGTTQVINSDKNWKTNDTEMAGWQNLNFNEVKWQSAKEIEEYGGSSWGRIDPQEIHHPPKSILVRKEFLVEKKVRQARAYVSGLGVYEMHLNGERVGKDIFTPGWTDFPTKVQYQTYDVTQQIKPGKNGVGAIIGNMWWSSGLGWQGANTYSNGPLRFLLQLVLDYQDGTTQTIVTDENWKTQNSPILENHIYHGETYDARLEQPGWDEANFDEIGWENALILNETAKLVAQQGPTIQITEQLAPIKISEPSPNVFVFDLGQNMVGWAKLKVSGAAGTKVVLRFAEVLKDDGNIYTENLRNAKATDCYILKGSGAEEWQPRFTYHGFRFVEVTGFPGTPNRESITGMVLHSNPPLSGSFACSNELINQIQKNINWGLRGNIHSVPTDCPQRDERLGWMGDAQIFAPTACYNRNMAGFFTKWERDIIDCQAEDGSVFDVNPAIVVGGPAKPGWGDAVVVIPWVVYNFYGDKRIIEENYQGMAGWINYMKNNAKDFIYDRKGYGDWIAVVKSPSEPIGAAYFYYSTKLLAKMAAIIGKDSDALSYENLADNIAEAFNKKYFNTDNDNYESGTQTANLLPLAFGITPEWQADKVIANVVNDIKQRDTHLSTGFLGTGYLLPMLSKYGYHDLAYQLAVQTTYPSWGYMVEKGATTIWELWNSDTEGPGMNSRNHFALGSVGEWYYGYLAGIRPDPDIPGFKRIIIAPQPVGDLAWAEAKVETAYGTVKSRWDKTDGRLILKLSLPANTAGWLRVPTDGKTEPTIEEGGQVLMQNGKAVAEIEGIKFVSLEKDAAVFEISAGGYEFVVY